MGGKPYPYAEGVNTLCLYSRVPLSPFDETVPSLTQWDTSPGDGNLLASAALSSSVGSREAPPPSGDTALAKTQADGGLGLSEPPWTPPGMPLRPR